MSSTQPLPKREKEPISRVGVVVPVLDAGPWLDRLLSSLEAQTYPHWQAVVVDDGSGDESWEVAARHAAADERIAAVRSATPGGGAPAARADGRSLLPVEASLLYFPDADDVLEPELLARLATRLGSAPDAVAAFCRYHRIDASGSPIPGPPVPRIAMTKRWSRRLRDDEAETPFESVYGWAAPASEAVTMFRADAYDAAGGWEGWSRQGGESIDLLCRLMLLGRVLFEPEPLYGYRAHGSQHSGDGARLDAAAAEIRASWRRRAELEPAVRPLVARAEFFVDHRLVPRRGLDAAIRHARSGRLLTGGRFAAGAARRYRWRFDGAGPATPPGRPR
jgi:glycosyltransferase involved in cell wall biosynthesis